MADELTELLDMALYKEVASQAFYAAGKDRMEDPGARALMKELSKEELKHTQFLRDIKEKGLNQSSWRREEMRDLKISEYLTGSGTLEGAGLQDTLIFAMKREQQAVEFYSRLMSVLGEESAKRLCERLVQEELRHKMKLELFYDDFFYGED